MQFISAALLSNSSKDRHCRLVTGKFATSAKANQRVIRGSPVSNLCQETLFRCTGFSLGMRGKEAEFHVRRAQHGAAQATQPKKNSVKAGLLQLYLFQCSSL